MSKSSGITLQERVSVASRVLAAALGGYALSAAATVLLGLLWPAPLAQGVFWATMLSFLIYACAVIWVFTTRTAMRAWFGLVALTLVFGALAWVLRPGA